MERLIHRVTVRVDASGGDAEETDRLTRLLRQELRELDVDVERPSAGPPPPGARAVDAIALGTLIVMVADKTGLLDLLVNTVKSWWRRNPEGASVKLEIDGDVIELAQATPEDGQRLIDLWVARHASERGSHA